MADEIPKQYEPKATEVRVTETWLGNHAFHATPDARTDRYVVMMPLPNVTGALHMGHAMDNVMQDLLIRWHRMLGENTLWMAGTDHAGIATQAVVEKRLFELEGKTRHDIGREALVQRIWDWKDQFQRRIVTQQQAMGCSCDWERQRFTMDAVCARAVRHTFYRMFEDGLIYRGNRLVNWDCHLQTAVADDEIEYAQVQGHFWHLRYPVIDPQPGEPEFVVVATTRPETMLGDTAVACHPDPAAALARALAAAREKLAQASDKERSHLETEVARLEGRRLTHLPRLIQLRDMARAGRRVRLPLLERALPLICDEWAKPELGSGCVKITPAHDPNDYDVWSRHRDEFEAINILQPDGTLNANAGAYQGLDRFDARKRVVADLETLGLLEAVEDREIEVGHSDRSKTPVEPYLSKQWFVRMGDVDGGVTFGRGTSREFRARGFAQVAMDAVQGTWRSPSGRKLTFHPDPERYGNTYLHWLAEKRDWCISRQLWWGHQIPIWVGALAGGELATALAVVRKHLDDPELCAAFVAADGSSHAVTASYPAAAHDAGGDLLVCLRSTDAEQRFENALVAAGLRRDPDVLDTWFSSGLWPHSTLGWPDPATAQVDPGQAALASVAGAPSCLDYYYPGSCLVTGRDIITLWVARMVIMGLYNLGDLPFTDCFIHANILDGKGEKMSKSKGNGIDPVDIIERYGTDAMRYVLCEMQTGSQDIRIPVQAVSPFTGNAIDLATAKRGRSIFTYLCPESGKEFDVLGTMDGVPAAKLISDRFDVGRNFCNKLWNAARFALLNLERVDFQPLPLSSLPDEDRWILSRSSRACAAVREHLERYNPSAAIAAVRDFFWTDLCDWYLELIKPRMHDASQAPRAGQVLAVALDRVLRLLHPFVPFITEDLWARLNERVPIRGIERELASTTGLLVHAGWPEREPQWEDSGLEARIEFLQETVRAVRDIRAKYGVPPREAIRVRIRATGASATTLSGLAPLLRHIVSLEELELAANVERSADAATAIVRDVEIFVPGVVDLVQEIARLQKQQAQLEKGCASARNKLANEKFLQHASTEVVARERERLAEMETELAAVASNLRALDGSKP
ncbi:MAG: valine--tRNA ligase [Planctomycetota bacterium]